MNADDVMLALLHEVGLSGFAEANIEVALLLFGWSLRMLHEGDSAWTISFQCMNVGLDGALRVAGGVN